jgi:hypothetical protein
MIVDMKRFFLLLTMFCWLNAGAQELDVSVSVNTPTLQLADPKVFETLETSIQEFMNSQVWTSDEYEQFERIKVNIALTVSEEFSATSFGGELAIQAVRPVYGSSYETPLLSHRDQDITFSYEAFQPIQYSENNFQDNLSSILSFYAFIILGLDYDSFSPYGGEPFFQRAQDVLNNVPSSVTASNPGWRSLEGNRNRYWIIENLLSPRIRNMRQAMYDYHRQGLDVMSSDVNAGRVIMLQALDEVGKALRTYPNAMIVQMFSNAKSSEIIEVFKVASLTDKNKVVQIMSRLDAANASKYNQIK